MRDYAPSDRDAVLRVWYESATLAYPFWSAERFAQERDAIMTSFLPTAETHVFERDGAVVGFISLLGTEVGGLFVEPRHQREGIGRALVDAVCGTRAYLEVDVFEGNQIARAFYERYGFQPVGESVDEATGLRVIRLRLPPNMRTDGTKNDG